MIFLQCASCSHTSAAIMFHYNCRVFNEADSIFKEKSLYCSGLISVSKMLRRIYLFLFSIPQF